MAQFEDAPRAQTIAFGVRRRRLLKHLHERGELGCVVARGGARDRREVELSQGDADLIDAVADGHRRVIVVLLCGRPLAIPPATLEKIDSLVVAWLPGTEGEGVTDALFGHAPTTGRLSFAWPRSPKQCTKSDRSHRGAALYPLGYGLDMESTLWPIISGRPMRPS